MLPSRMAKDISSSSSSSKSDHLPRQCRQKAERQLSTEKGRTKSSRREKKRDSSDKIVFALVGYCYRATELQRARKERSLRRPSDHPASQQQPADVDEPRKVSRKLQLLLLCTVCHTHV